MAIPPLILKIVADSSGVSKGVAETNAQVSGLKESMVANSALIKTALVGGVVVGLGLAAKAASDLGESQNKANVIFGDSVGLVNNFADSAASGFGISKQAALESAASFGAMFDSAGLAERQAADMSVTMTGLAGDMASFNNEDPSEMLERLRSGLAGEAEPLRRFGVFISEARVQTEAYRSGIAEVGTELTDAQKIQARFNIIMADTAKQQGDFARTVGESLPNQIRALKAEFTNLAAELGQHILPLFLSFVKVLREIPEPLLAAGAAMVTLAAATIAVNTAVKALSGTWLAKLLAGLSSFAGLAIVAVATWDQYSKAMQGATKDMAEADIQIQTGRGGMVLLKDQVNATGLSYHGLASSIGTINSALRTEETALAKVTKEHEEAAGAAREQRAAELSLAGGLLGLVGDLQTVNDAQQTVNRLRRQGKTDTAEYREATLSLATAVNSFTGNVRDYIQEGHKADLTNRDIVRGLIEQGKQFGLTRDDLVSLFGPLGQYVKGLGDIPSKVRTDVDLHTEAARSALANFISNASGSQIHVYLQAHLPNYPGRQHGGSVSATRPYVVGERGPELFVPSTSGTVVASGGGGGDVILEIDGQRFAQISRDQLLKLKGSRVSLGLS
jgi:hypothetical protein